MLSSRDEQSLLQRLVMVALLVGVFSLSAFGVVYFLMRGSTVEVPNVVGKTETDAAEALEDAGLRMLVKGRAQNDNIPAHTVSDQSPAPGAIVKTGQFVRVSVSLGTSPTQTN
ncbi:MAG: PASTA domain-containing protein [Acidobacteria bacterium]|nr:PASTA domain-containing protein [Acidobacteriota bacterium]